MSSIGRSTDKCVNPQTEMVRSAPIYVETGDQIVTLIKEGYATRGTGSAAQVKPVAVYVIDAKGVRRIALVRSPRKRQVVLVAILTAMCAVFWLLRPKH